MPIIHFLGQSGLSFIFGSFGPIIRFWVNGAYHSFWVNQTYPLSFRPIGPAVCCRGQSGLVFIAEDSRAWCSLLRPSGPSVHC